MKRIIVIILIALVVAGIAVAASAAGSKMTVQWQPRAIASSHVMVKDLVDIGRTSEAFLATWGDTPVPTNGSTVDTSAVVSLLIRNGLEPDRASFSGPQSIRLESRSSRLGPCEARIAQSVMEKAATLLNVAPSQITVQVTAIDGACPTSPLVLAPNQNVLGKNLTVRFQGEPGSENVTATLDTKAAINVAVTTKSIATGETIRSEQISFERRELSSEAASALRDESKFSSGQIRAATAIESGTVLTQQMVRTGSSLAKGDTVTITIEQGPLTVHTMGRLLANANVGETVLVENVDSKKQVSGRLVDEKHVQINY